MSIKHQLLTLALLTVFLWPLTACQAIQPLPAVTPGATSPEQAPPTGTELAAPDTASEILWDKWGVPHIFAQEPASAFYGLGWAQTHSRGDLLLRLYASARGRAAEFYGEEWRQHDQIVRLLGIPTLGEAWYQQQPADFQRDLDAFARGINDYAAQHPDQLSAEAQAVLPVNGADVVAHVTRVLALWVSGAGCKEVGARLGSNEEPSASNAWALAPTYTTSGHAMLLANPHAAWFDSASTFFEAHINLPAANIYGATLVVLSPNRQTQFSAFLVQCQA